MRIAAFYFVLYAANGLLTPYLPAYFQSLGFAGHEIASVSSLSNLSLIFIPPLWGVMADRSRKPLLLMQWACLGAALAFLPMLWATRYVVVIGVMVVYAVMYAPITALADTVALVEARRMGTEYARLRLWGSVGFIVSAYGFGYYRFHGGHLNDVVPAVLLVMAAYVLVAFLNRPPAEFAAKAPPTLADARRLAGNPAFLLFLLAGMIHWAALSSYYLFFTIHLTDLSVGEYVGPGFSLAVSAEILMMWAFRPLRARVPLLLLLGVASLLTSARWLLVCTTENGPALAIIQTGHAFSYGAFLVGSIAYVEQTVPPALLATGRAVFAAAVLGLGGVLGNTLSGFMFDAGRGKLAFLTSGLLELFVPLLLWTAWRVSRKVPVAAPGPQAGSAAAPR